MQTTLLAAAIGLILALVAALVGPLLIDWGTYRSVFEAEASRLIGLDVSVKGAIEARLLPAPQLTLHDIEIGRGADAIKAASLDVELALGPLMRGQWRATELRLSGPQVRLGLDSKGHVQAPALAIGFRPDALAIDRLSIQDGRVTLSDVASGGSLTLEQLYFNGEAGSLLGPFRGEGDVVVGGAHYPYRISAARVSDSGATRVKLNVDPRDRPLTVEADGMLTLEQGAPRFDGRLSLMRPAGIRAPNGIKLGEPWQLSGKVKASPASALLEDIDLHYGPQDRGVKLGGVAELRFGKAPRLQGLISGRQVDLDALMAGAAKASPAAAARRLAELAGGAFHTSIPLQIGLSIDQLTLAGGTLVNLRGDIGAGPNGWDLKSFEFRAPGFTQSRLSGHLALDGDAVTFSGPAEIDSSDPAALVSWLEGAEASGKSEPRSLRVRGDLTIGSTKLAVDHLTADFARKTATGRLAYQFAAQDQASKLEVLLNAPELDLDAALGFGRGLLKNSAIELPREVTVEADVGRASIAGVEARNLAAHVKLDAGRWAIERLAADLGGAAVSASGNVAFPGGRPQGEVTLSAEASEMGPITALLARFAPQGARLLAAAGDITPATLRGRVTVGPKGSASEVKLDVDGHLGRTRLALAGNGNLDSEHFRLGSIAVNGKLTAEDGNALLSLLRLNGTLTAGAGPGTFNLSAKGPAQGEWRVDSALTGTGLDARIAGTVDLFADTPAAALRLDVRKADLKFAREARPSPASLRAEFRLQGQRVTLRDIDASLAGSPLRGHLTADLGETRRIEGEIDAGSLDMPMLVAAVIGAPPVSEKGAEWPKQPFSDGWLGDYAGAVALRAQRVALLPGVEARNFAATMRLGKDELALENASGAVSGGTLSGKASFKSQQNGLAVQGKLALAGASIAPLLPASARPPVTGKLDLSLAVDGAGLSPVALIGSLHGSGKLAVENAELAGLDPRAFDAVTRAVDQGVAVDGARIADIVRKALNSGQLSITQGEGAIEINAGQVGMINFTANAADADLSLTGAYDLIDRSLDAHLVLSAKSSGVRPDIFIALKGPLTQPERSVDVSALTGWLTLRAVDNEARRLKAIEAPPVPAPPTRSPDTQSDLSPPKPVPVRRPAAPAVKRSVTHAPLQLAPPVRQPRPPIEVNNLPPPPGAMPSIRPQQ